MAHLSNGAGSRMSHELGRGPQFVALGRQTAWEVPAASSRIQQKGEGRGKGKVEQHCLTENSGSGSHGG